MLYQLPNGRSIHLSLEEYLNLTDEQINFLVAYEWGEPVNDPFRGSTIKKGPKLRDLDQGEEPSDAQLQAIENEVEEDDVVELPDVSEEEKRGEMPDHEE